MANNLNSSQLNPLSITIPNNQNRNTLSPIQSPIDQDVFIWTILDCSQSMELYGSAGLLSFFPRDVVRGTRRDMNDWAGIHLTPDEPNLFQQLLFTTPTQNNMITIQHGPTFLMEPSPLTLTTVIMGKRQSDIQHTSYGYRNEASNENVLPYRNPNNNSNNNLLPTPRPNARRRTQRKRRSH